MRAARRPLLVAAGALLLTGCVAGKTNNNYLVPVYSSGGDRDNIQRAAAQKLAQEVPIYTDAQLAGSNNYVDAGPIEASICTSHMIDAQDMVINILRQKAHDLGANGITALSCATGSSSEINGCFIGKSCSATALRIVEPDPSR